MRGRLLLLVAVSLSIVSCTLGEDGVVDVGATARSGTVAAGATRGAAQVASAERVRDELSGAIDRARDLHSGLLLLRIQMTNGALSDEAEEAAQQSVLAACDEWPADLDTERWPPGYLEFYAATGPSCERVAAVLAALRANAGDDELRALWQQTVSDLTFNSGFDIQLGTLLARLPKYSPTELMLAILERQ